MVALPTAADLPTAAPRPSTDVASYPRQFGRPSEVGQQIAGAGARLQQQQDEEDSFQYAQARSTYLSQKVALETSIQDAPDWQTAGQTYKDGMTKLQADTAATITNPRFQRQFQMEAGSDFAAGQASVTHFMRTKEVDQGRSDLDNLIQTNRDNALASPKDAPGFLSATKVAIQGAAAKGYISQDEAVKVRQTAAQSYAKGWLDMQQPADVVRILTGGKSSPGAGPDLKVAILGQESGDNDNIPNSVQGAVGPGQIEPGTFAQYAKPGESITNPADNRAVSGRILDDYSQRYSGDPARAAVAYFSGPGNVAPAGSSTPYLKDVADKNGKKTSDYVNDVMGRLGGGASSSGEPTVVAKTGTAADFIPMDQRASILREAVRQVKADGATSRAQFASTATDAIDYLHAGGDPSKVSITADQVRTQVGGPEGAKLADEVQHAFDYNKAATQIATVPQSKIDDILAGHAPSGPEDFKYSADEFGLLVKAAQARQNAIYGNGKTPGDPATYAITTDKTVSAAYDAAQKDPSNANKFGAYVWRLNGAYDQLGVDPSARRIMPEGVARAQVTKIQSAAPQDAVGLIHSLQSMSGKFWPQVYGDLNRAGLPASFQALAVTNEADQPVMVAALQRDAEARAKGQDQIAEQMRGVKYTSDGSDSAPSVTGAVEAQLAKNDAFGSLRQTFGVGGRQGVDSFANVFDAVRSTALYLYQKGGTTPQDAADKAASMVTANYDFVPQGDHPPVRLPKGQTSDFQTAASNTIQKLTASDVVPYRFAGDEDGNVVNSTTDQLRDQAFQGAQNAYWVTVPGHDGAGAVRAIDPQSGQPVLVTAPGGSPVTLRDGRKGFTLDIPLSKLSSAAIQARKDIAAEPVMPIGGN